ncbi:hypothetical protein [Acidianus manzaensis]|uniref:Uncharacterized protein n=1 Tax=Acidianus manzaensis TaxID=282676 RepID=A0A1W6K305_9CREN|nr:hypothetical protein [Acidianus manzaensis]ARM76908.1 hypothetical protein B6F84_13365 [Acidianus manzaensis]
MYINNKISHQSTWNFDVFTNINSIFRAGKTIKIIGIVILLLTFSLLILTMRYYSENSNTVENTKIPVKSDHIEQLNTSTSTSTTNISNSIINNSLIIDVNGVAIHVLFNGINSFTDKICTLAGVPCYLTLNYNASFNGDYMISLNITSIRYPPVGIVSVNVSSPFSLVSATPIPYTLNVHKSIILNIIVNNTMDSNVKNMYVFITIFPFDQ